MGELSNRREIEQGLAEALKTGDARSVGHNRYELTAKGVTRVAIMAVRNLIVSADSEHRDFTTEEKMEVLKYVKDIESKIERH